MTAPADLAQGLRSRGLLDVVRSVCDEGHASLDDVLSACRTRSVVACRRACAFELQRRGLSTSEIGRLLGRDHTTVLHMLGRTRRGKAKRARDGGEA